MKVLIADDCLEFGGICSEALKGENIETVTIKKNNKALLQALKNRSFDAAIIDLTLLNDEIISKIKSYNTKIIVVSVYDLPYAKRKAIESSTDFFLLLPCDIDTIVEIVKRVGGQS